MSTPAASYSQNLNLLEPPNGAADYDRDLKQNFRIVDFISSNKNNYVLSGLAVTAGSGLTVNWAAGSARVNNTDYSISASSGSATDNTADTQIHLTNYVFVNNSGAVTISTSLPTTEYTPLAIVFTNAGAISKVVDCRKYSSPDTVPNKTTNYTVVANDCTGRTTLTNAGAGASAVTFTLPVGAANYIVHFNHIDSGNLVIDPNGTEALYIDGVSLGAGVALTSANPGTKYTCTWNSSGGWWEVTQSKARLGTRVAKTAGTSYLADTDGFITFNCYANNAGDTLSVYSDASNPPTTEIAGIDYAGVAGNRFIFTVPIKRNQYYKVTLGGGMTARFYWWTPLA